MQIPLHFFYFAKNLHENLDNTYGEAMARTCVGRFYYSAFLCVRKHVKASSGNELSHEKLHDYFFERGQNKKIGNTLKNLKLSRVNADYKLKHITSSKDTARCLRQTEYILTEFGHL